MSARLDLIPHYRRMTGADLDADAVAGYRRNFVFAHVVWTA